MINLIEYAKLHKSSKQLGFSSRLPLFLLYLWYIYKIYVDKGKVLITDHVNRGMNGFLLYDLINKEILVLVVKKYLRKRGIGSKLVKALPNETIIVKTISKVIPFYEKNNFMIYMELDKKNVMMIKHAKI